ncbi:DUF779 domain-containing protein [Brevibacterium ammoniilyticum]|uniref:DUF779 domain-containing protein n=1 Tax=Brevibacterium ammoniilyticum TaxID=1046555 RepID=A0ABP9U4E0_9MICO
MSEQIDTAKVGATDISTDRTAAESSVVTEETAPLALESTPTIEGETKSRVAMTQATVDLLGELVAKHGQLMFHQSGGCCDGSSPMCFPEGDFLTSDADVLLGHFELPLPEADANGSSANDGPTTSGIDFWMSAEQFEYWKHTHLTVDVVPGRGAGFSVESPTGNRFIIRSTLMDIG